MKLYVAKPRKVQAEQYLQGVTPPAGTVHTCEWFPPGREVPHVHTDAGMQAIVVTDWILWDRKGIRLMTVMSDADFQEEFGGGAP